MKIVLSRVLYGLKLAEDYAAALILAVMAVMVVINVTSRNLAIWGLAWNEEFTIILLIWMTFLGAMLCERLDRQLEIKSIREALPARWRQGIRRLTRLGALVLVAILVRGSIDYFMASSDALTSELRWPSHIAYSLPVVIGMAMILFHMVYSEITGLRQWLLKRRSA